MAVPLLRCFDDCNGDLASYDDNEDDDDDEAVVTVEQIEEEEEKVDCIKEKCIERYALSAKLWAQVRMSSTSAST